MDENKKSKKQLKRQLKVQESSNFWALTKAYDNISKCGKDKYMGSGITITIKNLEQEKFVVCEEFLIIDGLSKETIEAIKNDIKASYELKLSLIPKLKG